MTICIDPPKTMGRSTPSGVGIVRSALTEHELGALEYVRDKRLAELRYRLDALRNLEEGWDGEDGVPLNGEVQAYALKIAARAAIEA